MLADEAAVYDGKLFIHGGGWDRITANQFPTAHPKLAVVMIICVEYSEALDPAQVRVRLMDEDGNDMNVGAVGNMMFGHAPGMKRGQETLAPIALPFVGVTFSRAGRYRFDISLNGKPVGELPFTVDTPPVLPPIGPASVPGV